eukprot:4615112-Amphidinium_carterae.1
MALLQCPDLVLSSSSPMPATPTRARTQNAVESTWASTPTRLRRSVLRTHPSHDTQLYQLHGTAHAVMGHLVACLHCGAYTQRRLVTLSSPCQGAIALTPAKRQQLQRIQSGRHPNARARGEVCVVHVGTWADHAVELAPVQ